jgi:hypothetical protein
MGMSDTYAQVMRSATPAASNAFDAAVADFRAGVDMVGAGDADAGHFAFEDVPAPKRLAPHAYAIAATVYGEDEEEVASGRLVLLYDPAGGPGWSSVFRLVAYVRADIEPEVAADPLLGEVGWTWLTEALEAPGYTAESGTVTRVITEGYGAKSDELPTTNFELRASWSPVMRGGLGGSSPRGSTDEATLADHVVAWCSCLAAAAGLEPPGTRAIRR